MILGAFLAKAHLPWTRRSRPRSEDHFGTCHFSRMGVGFYRRNVPGTFLRTKSINESSLKGLSVYSPFISINVSYLLSWCNRTQFMTFSQISNHLVFSTFSHIKTEQFSYMRFLLKISYSASSCVSSFEKSLAVRFNRPPFNAFLRA